MIARLSAFLFAVLLVSTPASAQDREVPYWASIRAKELNMRVGPSEDYKIDWVYRRKGLPVKVIRVMEGWRLIEDPDGTQGWVVARLLTDDRGAIVVGEGESAIYAKPDRSSTVKWRIEPGVVGTLGDCDDNWCEFAVDNRRGYVPEQRLWGAGEP